MTQARSVTIRTALRSDVAACSALFARVQQEIEPRSPPWREDEFVAQIEGEDVLVGVAGRDLAGFLSWLRHDGFVHFLHVAPAWRGRGLGRRLLAQARAGSSRPLELKCLVANRRALAFYRRLGWQPVHHDGSAGAPYVRLRQPA